MGMGNQAKEDGVARDELHTLCMVLKWSGIKLKDITTIVFPMPCYWQLGLSAGCKCELFKHQ